MRAAVRAIALLVFATQALATADPVPWQAAGDHVGRTVTIEGFVARGERRGRQLTLLFDPEDASALRVTLMIPIVTDLPTEPERLYAQRRVRVRGRIQRVAGHLDLIVTDPDRIEVLGLLPTDESTEVAPSTSVPTLPAEPSACARQRQAWETERTAAARIAADLAACLSAGRRGCAALADTLAPGLTRLEWAEQRLRAICAPAQ